ncbi:MAG: hypothetical protein ACAI25_07580, partial [Planctomycetota bacterium]
MNRRRLVVVGLLLVLALLSVAAWKRDAIRMRWLREALAKAKPGELEKRVADLDEPTLELVAFDAELLDEVTRRWRQAALDEFKKRHPKVTPELLVRYLRDAQGLERRWILVEIEWPETPELFEAAASAAISDTDGWVSLRSCEFLRFKGKKEALPQLRLVAAQAV